MCGRYYLPNFHSIFFGNLAAGQDKMLLLIARIPLPSLEAHDGYAKKDFHYESEERRCVPVSVPVSTTVGTIVGDFFHVECVRYGFSISLLFKWSLGSGGIKRFRISSVSRGEETPASEPLGRLIGQQSNYYVHIIIVKVGCQKVKC